MDKSMRKESKEENNKLKKYIFKLPNFCWSMVIFILSILQIVLSYCTYGKHNWLSGVLVSTSCGYITGLIFYFLSNIRNNKETKLRKEYADIKTVNDSLNNIINFSVRYRTYLKYLDKTYNVFDDAHEKKN